MFRFFIAALIVVLPPVGSREALTAQDSNEPIYTAALSHLKDSDAIPSEWVFRVAVSSQSEESEREQTVAAARRLGLPVIAKEFAFSCPPGHTPLTECSLPEPGSVLAHLYEVIRGGQGTTAVVRVVLYKQAKNSDTLHGEGWSLELTRDRGHWAVTKAVLTYIT